MHQTTASLANRRQWLLYWGAVVAWAPGQAAGAAPTAPVIVDGQTFALQAQVGGNSLVLNGVGLKAVRAMRRILFKGYAAALYLPQATERAEQVLRVEHEARRLQLRLFVGVSASEFAKAFRDGVTRYTTPEHLPALEPRMLRFETLVRDMGDLQKGDVIDLDWTPETGLVLRYNGKALGQPVPGADLYAALLAIFVGDKVRERDLPLKAGLLGGPVA
jgi:hypothetical protein